MKKMLTYLIMFVFVSLSFIFCVEDFKLKGINYPTKIKIKNKFLFVIEEGSVFLYSLETQQLIRKIGKKGKGPGEFEINPGLDMNLNLEVFKDKLFLSTPYKTGYFDLQGKLLEEKRNSFFSFKTTLLNDRYIVQRYNQKHENPEYVFSIMNKDFSLVKDFATLSYSYKAGVVEPIQKYKNFVVYDQKIYVVTENDSLEIEEFDSNGDMIKVAKITQKKLKFSEVHKIETQKWLGKKSWFKMIPAAYRKTIKYPKCFPLCKNFVISEDKIFIHTTNRIAGKSEFLVKGLNDSKIFSVLLPVNELNFMEYLPYDISDGVFYYVEEKSEGDWIVNSVAISRKMLKLKGGIKNGKKQGN